MIIPIMGSWPTLFITGGTIMLFAVVILVLTDWGIPLVRDLRKPQPVFWKLPGGKGEVTEKPEESAVRELAEEIGVKLSASDLRLVVKQDRGTHELFVFQANVSPEALGDVKHCGAEGEEIGIFSPQEILEMRDFFPNHLGFVKEALTSCIS